MKSFLIAILLIASVSLFVCFHAHRTASAIDEMLVLIENLPQSGTAFASAYEAAAPSVHQLVALWDREFPRIAFTAGYENTNRCDEAIGALSVYFENGSGTDFLVALSEFKDSLERLRILESFHIEGIF